MASPLPGGKLGLPDGQVLTATGGTARTSRCPARGAVDFGEAIPSWARLVATACQDACHVRCQLRHVDRPAAADPRDGLIAARSQVPAERHGAVVAAVQDPDHLGNPRRQRCRDRVALARADRDGDPPAAGDLAIG
jgi:hypothetical protein